MKVLVTGSRFYANDAKVWHELGELRRRHPLLTIIQGGASGADLLAREWCKEVMNVKCITESVTQEEWKRYGRYAGNIRNQRMLDMHAPDLVLAFPGGKGTADMVRRARHYGVPVKEVI